MANIIVSLVIVSILSISAYKIYSDKKQGVKCIGCPYSPKKGTTQVIQFDL